jgi:hypothetical protein
VPPRMAEVLELRRTNGGTPPPLLPRALPPRPPTTTRPPTLSPRHRGESRVANNRGGVRACVPLSLPPRPPAPPPPPPTPRCASRLSRSEAEERRTTITGADAPASRIPPIRFRPTPLPRQLDPTDQLASRRGPRSHVMASFSFHAFSSTVSILVVLMIRVAGLRA